MMMFIPVHGRQPLCHTPSSHSHKEAGTLCLYFLSREKIVLSTASATLHPLPPPHTRALHASLRRRTATPLTMRGFRPTSHGAPGKHTLSEGGTRSRGTEPLKQRQRGEQPTARRATPQETRPRGTHSWRGGGVQRLQECAQHVWPRGRGRMAPCH